MKTDVYLYSGVVMNKQKTKVIVLTIAVSSEIEELNKEIKSPLIFATISIKSVLVKSLIDTDLLDDFIGNYFVTTNHIFIQKYEKLLSI